ncbi:MAG: hypothetical protein EXS03_08295 [Phycisphaerales bacterium]|nr:hypothetical protein [Phycisphaerales bacterium]
MTLTKYVGILASGLAITGVSAQGTDAMSEIAQLKAEVATLKSQNGDKWLTEERAAEIKSLVKDVLADSETRTSLQGTAATSGYNNGFFVSSADGNFKLNASFLAQARFTYNHQAANSAGTAQVSNTTWGFENRRTGMAFSGNVVDPSWTYSARFNYGSTVDPYTPVASAMVLQDAWGAKDFGNGFSVKIGQFKSPFMAESLRNDGAQLTAERSVVDYYFSGGYTQGVAASYLSDQFRATGSYNNGPRVQNGNWAGDGNNSISLAGRFEFKAMGAWGQFDSESSAKSDEAGFMVGAAAQYYNNRGGTATGAWYPSVSSPVYGASVPAAGAQPTTTGALDWTLDATYKSGGMSVSAALVGANYGAENTPAGPVTKYNSYGMVLQGGYRFTDTLEGFGRWEWVDVKNGAVNPTTGTVVTDVNNFVTFGVNVYAGSNVKWTTQFGISLTDVGGNINLTGAGYLPDNNTAAKDQFNIITQLQLAF